MPLPELVLLDTNCFIYLLEDPGSARGRYLAEQVFRPGLVGRRRLFAATLTVTELLSQPFAAGQARRAGALLAALEGLPGLFLLPLTVGIATDAARLRGQSRVSVPDAIVLASAIAVEAALLTNDRRLTSTSEEVTTLLLDDLVASADPAMPSQTRDSPQ